MTAASVLDRLGVVQDRVDAALTPRRVRIALATFGVAFAVFASFRLVAELPAEEGLMGTRTDGISASIAVLEHGGPPLLGAKTQYGAPGVDPHADYYPVGVTDDQGLYLYLPVLGVVVGERDPHVLLKWFFIGCFVLLFAVYPLLVYEFMGSVLASVAAPVLVFHWFSFLEDTDLYWIVGWCVLLGLPLVFAALVRPWGRWSIALLLASAFVASFSTSIRIHAGLPIVIAALVVGAVRAPSWRARILVCVAILVASFSIDVGVMDTVRLTRDEIVGQPFRNEFPTQHPTWHNAYIGLGYLPNKYGITWNDQVSIDAVKRVDPHAGYLTPRYEHILRHLYFKLLHHDPSFVLGTLWTKFGVCARDAIGRFGWLWPFLFAVAGLIGARRTRMRWLILLSAPALVLTLLPPVVTVPYPQYETGLLSAVGLLWTLFVLWALASAPDLLRWARSRSRTDAVSLGISRREIVVTLVILAALVALTRPAIVHARGALHRASAHALTPPVDDRPMT